MALNEPLAKSGESPILLSEHLSQVAHYARKVIKAYQQHWEKILGSELKDKLIQALVLSSLTHDLGKIALGFQKALQDRKFRWEFRHEVLSAAILISTDFPEDELKELTIAAVLTHHRDLEDRQLCQDSGFVSLPMPDILEEVEGKFKRKVDELKTYWDWLENFWRQHQELSKLQLPKGPGSLPMPVDVLESLKECVKEASFPSNRKGLALLLARGWLMASDHAISAGVTDFKESLPSPNLPPLRKFQERLSEHKGNVFFEAPTGSGKTLAAVLWALRNRQGGERIFYLLPYQASIEAMADIMEGYFGKENVAVLHARALDFAFREHFEQRGEYEAAASYAKAEVELNRLAHKPIKVATPFQLLKWLFGIPRWEIGVSEMVGGLFIFDEIHAYDAHIVALIVEMVRILKDSGGRFLFMSATFPLFLKQLLQEALGESAFEFTLTMEDDWSCRFLSKVRHRLRWRDMTLESLIPEILQEVREGKRVLVVANRVAQAQEIYKALKEQTKGVHLLHSRFTHRDRVKQEQKIISALRGKNDLDVRVLVATQVIEVSLDVSFDTIFTELAPVDDLLQRFGRVNRYASHPNGVEVHVAKQFDIERLKYVYDLERLQATLDRAPKDKTPLTFDVANNWVQEVYQSGWTEKERSRFENARKAFANLLRDLRPLSHLDEGREEFHGLFKSIEVLPRKFFAEYNEHFREKRYLLANQLLVPVPLGTFHMLNKCGRLDQLGYGVLLAEVTYDDELGLLPKEVEIDASII